MTDVAYSDPRRVLAHPQPLSLRYRRPAPSVPLRVGISPAYRRVRRVVAPAGESLSFVASNESNQSKNAEHQLIWASRFGYKGSAGHCHALDKPHTCCDFFATRLASHRRGQGMFAQQTTALLLGPVGGVEERRGLGPRAQARFVNRLRAACLSAVNEVNAASSARAPNTEHRRAVRP